MKLHRNLLALLSAFFLAPAFLAGQATVTLRCEVSNCGGSLALYTFDGFSFQQVERIKAQGETQVFEFKVPASTPRFYYVGAMAEQSRPVILGEEKQVFLQGNCAQMRNAEVTGSALNRDYDALKQKMEVLSNRSGQVLRSYAYAQNETQRNDFQQQMKILDMEKTHLLDSLRKTNPFLARVAALNTYVSYLNNNNNKYPSEVDYFANEFFRFADFSDPGYNHLPWIYEAMNSYTQTLTSVNLDNETMVGFLNGILKKFPEGSSAQQLAFAGILNGLQQRKHESFNDFAAKFVTIFGEKNPQAASSVQASLQKARRLSVGSEAPDFSQETPDGKMLKLSDLRGKYVLIDFWASWCGPCRRENPNVVRMYNVYKDKGFEILGVSLDQSRDKWLDAIEKDGLKWPHVSDLKGWANAVAQDYEVNSIPKTILVDPKGIIVAKDLRGPTLERMLAKLFD